MQMESLENLAAKPSTDNVQAEIFQRVITQPRLGGFPMGKKLEGTSLAQPLRKFQALLQSAEELELLNTMGIRICFEMGKGTY